MKLEKRDLFKENPNSKLGSVPLAQVGTTLPREDYETFRLHVMHKGYKMSYVLRELMKEFVEDNPLD